MIRVLIRAASPIAQAGLERLIRANDDFQLVSAQAGADLAGGPMGEPLADVVIAEVEGPDDELPRELLDWVHGGGALVLLTPQPWSGWAEALRAGVRAVLPRDVSGSELTAAVEAAISGLIVVHPRDLESLVQIRSPYGAGGALAESLTPREVEVLGLMAEGLGNKEIAARLAISDHTVKFHVASILGKLGAASRTEAVTIGLRYGLILI